MEEKNGLEVQGTASGLRLPWRRKRLGLAVATALIGVVAPAFAAAASRGGG